ncbi:MAG TPA: hemerythrin domain-containing protein [Chryseosolibacter sp.]
MEDQKPIRRDQSLQPFSRDHHHSLLLCWKIRKGFSKGVEVLRIKRYADWFFANHIEPHFREEEQHIFPILGTDNELVKKAIGEHRKLSRLFRDQKEVEKSLSLIEETLDSHIRFEERVLFNEVQKKATPRQLEVVSSLHAETKFRDNTEDEFWK